MARSTRASAGREAVRPTGSAGSDARPGRLGEAAGRLARHPLALTGSILVLAHAAIVLLAPWLAPTDPNAIDYRAMLAAPSATHPLGTDDLGRDLLSRLLHGARVSLGVSVTSVLLAVVAGVPLG